MEGVQAGFGSNPLLNAGLAPARANAMAAAASDGDLGQHLQELADDGQLLDFLDQTGDAIALAQGDETFAGQLDPLLGKIRDALAEFPVGQLSRVERDAVEATQQALDAYLGPIDDVGGGGEVPGGGLEAHEDAGAHLIDRHVGKTEQQLLDRLQKENISASSSFRDLPSAEHFIAETIAEHQDKIDAWVDGKGGNRLVLDAHFDASTGISIKRGDTQAEDVFSVKLVLERSNALGIGYRIVTGYPTTP
ncbi:RNase A-like domain-containing protein [Luteimonas lutimaris]|uniref:Bacterial CdiA-CT RNAse A domain-containing protein n=1 Tax=Luteimonas lutimaris TaxID=698645 RepID=A0ABP7M9B6_9GAMM|nr:RNase A-like domain-containing protein [Luteimonas sp.]